MISSVVLISKFARNLISKSCELRNHDTSAANRHRVMEAARQLGYLPVVDQVALPSKPAHLEFFLPIGDNDFMIDLARHIEDYAARLPLVASCRIHNLSGISPGALQAAVENLSLRANRVGSIASAAPYLTKKFIEPRLIFKENVPVL